MNSTLEVAQELTELWLRTRHRVLTVPCAGGLAGVVATGQPVELIPGQPAEPRLAVSFDSLPESAMKEFRNWFDTDEFTHVLVQLNLNEPPNAVGGSVTLTLGHLVADLQGVLLEEPAVGENSPAGRLFSLLLQAGYRSPRFPVRRQRWHLVPHEKGWALKRQGESEPEEVFATKETGVNAGAQRARAAELGQLIIHREDGRFEEERTYGQDPPDRG